MTIGSGSGGEVYGACEPDAVAEGNGAAGVAVTGAGLLGFGVGRGLGAGGGIGVTRGSGNAGSVATAKIWVRFHDSSAAAPLGCGLGEPSGTAARAIGARVAIWRITRRPSTSPIRMAATRTHAPSKRVHESPARGLT